MGQKSKLLLKSPKKEEQEVPESCYEGIEMLDELEGFLGISHNNYKYNEEAQEEVVAPNFEGHFLGWDFGSSNWEEELFPRKQEGNDDSKINTTTNDNHSSVKREEVGYCGNQFGFWDENYTNVMEETKASLNLNLNYEEVLQAWSNRSSLWAHHHHHPLSMTNNNYLGEVPNMEEERARRETSVIRYKEKRQSRLFAKKIRYEVRKLNADKRPRLKGRFVKRAPNILSKGE